MIEKLRAENKAQQEDIVANKAQMKAYQEDNLAKEAIIISQQA